MAKIDRFEDLTIWQDARSMVKEIYRITNLVAVGKDFKFVGQMRASGISIMNNIAEGFECQSDRKFSNYLDIAKGSCGEVRSMLYVALDVGYISESEFKEMVERCSNLSKAIHTLKRYLDKS